MTPAFTIRPIVDAERPWVADSWLRSWGDALHHRVPPHGRVLVAEVLAGGQVLVAGLSTGTGPHAVGWVAWQLGAVHYVYVRHVLRRQGIARRLLEAVEARAPVLRVTIITRHGRALAEALWGRVPRIEPWPRMPLEGHDAEPREVVGSQEAGPR